MLTLLGVAVTQPDFLYVQQGAVQYTKPASLPGVGHFTMTAHNVDFQQGGTIYHVLNPTLKLDIQLKTNAGTDAAISSTGSSTISVTGIIDLNGNGTADADEPDNSLFAGDVTQFGFRNFTNLTADQFDFRINPTGGELSGLFGQSVGMTLTSEYLAGYASQFNGSFSSNFANNGNAKGSLGSIQQVVGDFVWEDLNGNGIQDPAERGINGVTVNLRDSNGILKASTTTATNAITGGDGYYIFDGVPSGTYQVEFVKPAGYALTPATLGSDTSRDSNPNPNTDIATVILAPGGAQDVTIDAGLYRPVSIGNRVWEDLNGNGVQESGEPGIDGVSLTLSGTTGVGSAVQLQTNTAGGGYYAFSNLPPGTYTVSATTPNGFVSTQTGQGTPSTDNNPNPSGTTPARLTSGQQDDTIDFGFYKPVILSGAVYADSNNNGLKDISEMGISEVTLVLSGNDAFGTIDEQTTTTDGVGHYEFPALRPGTYVVTEKVQPSGYLDGRETFDNVTPVSGSGGRASGADALSLPFIPSSGVDGQNNFGEVPIVTGLQLVKLTNGNNSDTDPALYLKTGAAVTWTYTATNPGNVPLNIVSITDDQGVIPVFQTGDADGDEMLDPGEVWVYAASGVATAGAYSNAGKITGTPVVPSTTPPMQSITVTDSGQYFGYTAGITIDKLTNGTENDAAPGLVIPAGSLVTWTYLVSSTGNVPLSGVGVSDDVAGVSPTPILDGDFNFGDSDHDHLLDVGETWSFTASGIATTGAYSNIGTAAGTPVTEMGQSIAGATAVTATNPDYYFGYTSNIAIQKLTNDLDSDASPGAYLAVGSTATWTYKISTTGNVPLGAVSVTDSVSGVSPSLISGDNGNGRLEPGEVWIYTASGTVAAGQYTNVGTATGTPVTPDGGAIAGAATATATDSGYYFGSAPSVKLTKYTNGSDNPTGTGPVVKVGSAVTWTYEVRNTGNVPVKNILVSDDKGVTPIYVSGDANSNGQVDLSETWTFAASDVATLGQYSNVGTVTAKDAIGTIVTSTDADRYYGYSSNISIVKKTNGFDNDAAPGVFVPVGSAVTWTYAVTTSGNVPLAGVAVTDNIAGVTPAPVLSGVYNTGDANQDGLLSSGETWMFTAGGVAVGGQYSNVGKATGTPVTATGAGIIAATSLTATNPDNYFGYTSNIAIQKLTNGSDNNASPGLYVAAGSAVTWTYKVTTAGNVPLANVGVTDSVSGVTPAAVKSGPYNVGDADHDNLLDNGESWTFAASGTAVTGSYTNVGTATGTPVTSTGGSIAGASTVTGSDPENYYGFTSNIFIVKQTNGTNNDAAPGLYVPVGSAVTWTYAVSTTGNVPLAGVVVTDSVAGVTPGPVLSGGFNVGDLDHDQMVDPGEKWMYTASGTAVAGQYSNVGTAKGTPVKLTGSPLPGAAPVTASNAENYFGYTLSTVSGFVYLDTNNNGVKEACDSAIGTDASSAGIVITLTGSNDLGPITPLVTQTDATGKYSFTGLRKGTYTITETQPSNYVNGKDSLGTINGVVTGTNVNVNDNVLSVSIPFSSTAINYNFGETLPTTLATGDTATIGFWRNQNGQALLSKSNGGPSSKQLGTWLATNFPRLWGASAPAANNMSGKTNAQVAAYYVYLFGTLSETYTSPPKTECQVMSAAFAVYSTSSKLAGGSYATAYGFKVTMDGIGAKSISVLGNGAAFGVANNSMRSVFQCLQKANAGATLGVIYSTNSGYRSSINSTFSAINEIGDIV